MRPTLSCVEYSVTEGTGDDLKLDFKKRGAATPLCPLSGTVRLRKCRPLTLDPSVRMAPLEESSGDVPELVQHLSQRIHSAVFIHSLFVATAASACLLPPCNMSMTRFP